MSFRINTNLQAMNALRSLSKTSTDSAMSMTRLSTGLRINSGADDPAGLQISEGFRAQLTGISQALTNTQSAQNFAKTAEGALAETGKLLQDARSLALANSNDATLTTAQKQANQDQMNSILTSIDRISTSSSYGSKKLLDGSVGVSASITDTAKIAGLSLSGAIGGQSITASGNIQVAVSTAAVKASVNGKTFTTTTVAATEATALGAATSLTVNGKTYNFDASKTMKNVVDAVNADSGTTGVAMSIELSGTDSIVKFKSTKFGANGNNLSVSSDSALITSAVGTQALAGGVNAIASVTVGALAATAFTAGSADDGLTLRDSSGNVLRLTEAGGSSTFVAANKGYATAGSAQFQIGANSGQTVALALASASAASLGVSGADIMTTTTAATALANIDSAIDKVSKNRGDIGNFMRNVLDSNTRSLGVAQENLSAADSAIRDVDVADEMTKFTKLQILQQSGMSMLAQANSAPQSVLSLLRG